MSIDKVTNTMLKMFNRFIPWLLGAALLMVIPGRILAQAPCGPFADVLASDPFCPFILQAFNNGITSGTGTNTFSPNNTVTREQMVVFFDKGVDITLHRGTVRTAIGKTWAPISTNGGIGTDVGDGVNDIVSDGTFLWILRNDGKILKVNAADRRLLETWSPKANIPKKLGIFGGQVWAVDDQGSLQFFNPTQPAGSTIVVRPNGGIPPGSLPTLAFDGTNLWLGNAQSKHLQVVPPGAEGGIEGDFAATIESLVFDGTNMWVLLADSTLLKMVAAPNGVPTIVETLTLPTPVADCRMVYDGSNIWIPDGPFGILYVVHPTTTNPAVLPSTIILNTAVPNVAFPYVASFDGENVMIGGVLNGTVAVYKASTQTLIGTFASGANGVRGIASDGKTFNIGDTSGTKFFQF